MSIRFWSLTALLLISSTIALGQDNYHRVRVSLANNTMKSIVELGVDIDHAHPLAGRYVDLELSEKDISILQSNQVSFQYLIKDLSTYYENQIRTSDLEILQSRGVGCNEKSCSYGTKFMTPSNFTLGSMGGFYTYEEMNRAIALMKVKYPHIISDLTPIEPYKTYNGNKINWVRISNSPNKRQNKPQILFTALHHAREPMSLSQMIFYMWYLLENYEKDPVATSIINNTELYFVPCVNPDGYQINNTNQPNGGGMWRKNAFRNQSGVLTGVDLNRNYGYQWGYDNEGSSPNPSSEVYRGPSAFSEPETQAMSSFISANNFVLALNYHSHGNYLVHPWGHTSTRNPDAPIFVTAGDVMTGDNCYIRGTGEETVGYKVNGDADDWMYGDVVTKNRIISFTPEVGKSFYPLRSDIIDIAKSSLEMNLLLPQIARNYTIAEPVPLPQGLNKTSNRFGFVLKKVGFQSEQVKIKLSIDKGRTFSNLRESVQSVNLASGSQDTIYLNFQLDENIRDGETVTFTYTVFYDEVEKQEQIGVKYYNAGKTLVFGDDFENPVSSWNFSGNWGYTDVLKTSGRYSLTDSPSKLYSSNTTTYARMPGFIDLSNVNKADITFMTKWAIEPDFDYAQVQGSFDGINYFALCGKYTKTNNILQVVYDGFQDEWVSEQISLDEYIGAKRFFIRFVLVADQLNNFDGIYIDQFRVETIGKLGTSVTDFDGETLTVYPNPASTKVSFGKQVHSFTIKGIDGKQIMVGSNSSNVDVSTLKSGIYYIDLITSDSSQKKQVVKFVKL